MSPSLSAVGLSALAALAAAPLCSAAALPHLMYLLVDDW